MTNESKAGRNDGGMRGCPRKALPLSKGGGKERREGGGFASNFLKEPRQRLFTLESFSEKGDDKPSLEEGENRSEI